MMKKFLLTLAVPLFIFGCGTPAGQEEEADLTPEVEEIHRTSEEILTDSEDLEKELDDFIDNL